MVSASCRFFGSVLREDFQSDSDVDVLVQFTPGAAQGYWSTVAFSTSWKQQALEVRAENERRFSPQGVRERLMARRQR